jgi:hypothetical protein
MSTGWIGVDLDGTLAFYDHWRGPHHIGQPIPAMLARVKQWISQGIEVRIFTARVESGTAAISMGRPATDHCANIEEIEAHIRKWCREHVGCELSITCKKDFGMIELWDDRCVQVIPNTGRTLADEFESQKLALTGKAALQP